jgi:hypothetical protein
MCRHAKSAAASSSTNLLKILQGTGAHHAVGRIARRSLHIANRQSEQLPAIYGWLESFRYQLDIQPYHTWRDELVHELPPSSPGHSVLPLIPQHPTLSENRHPVINCRNTFAALAGTGIDVQPPDERLMHLVLQPHLRNGVCAGRQPC